MRLSHLLLSVPLFLVVACSSTPPPVKEIQPAPLNKQEFASILDNNFRGFLFLQHNKAYFTRCETEQVFPVPAKATLATIYQQLASTEPAPVYIEFTGEITFPKRQDSDAEVLMRIDRVHHMAPAKTSLQCAKPVDSFRFKAQGEEPYWRLNIDGQKLFFATKARNQVYQIEKTNFQTTQKNSVKSINKQEERLDLVIEPEHCYNVKNNQYWGYTATLDSIWGKLHGCGELGWPALDQKFSGYYLSQTAAKVANLTLNADNSVTYSEQSEGKNLLKTGFWKSNSPERVVVMLTRQENKRIREELVFQRQGLALSAQQINQNNIVTDFAPPGLVFNKMSAKEGMATATQTSSTRILAAQLIAPPAEVDIEVQKAVAQYFKIHRTDPSNTKFNSVTFDLNGDGMKEAIVLLDWCSSNGCEMLIFEGRNSGYRFLSRISRVNAPITLAKAQHYSWQSLLIENNSESYRLDFDGISYPIHSRDLPTVNKQEHATGVVLFNRGRPENWFPIKQ